MSVNSCFKRAVTFGALCKLAYRVLTRSKRPCHWCLLSRELNFTRGMTDMIFTLDWSSELLTGLSLPWLIFNARDVAGNLQPTPDYLTSPKSDSLSACRKKKQDAATWLKKADILNQCCTSSRAYILQSAVHFLTQYAWWHSQESRTIGNESTLVSHSQDT